MGVRMIFCFTVFVIFAANGIAPIVSMPWHASCVIKWVWPENQCVQIQSKIEEQIHRWNNTNCGTGEKCGYWIDSKKDNQLFARHSTPVKKYIDDLTFTFSGMTFGSGCHVEGKSSSEVWYAVLDYGTNYCNLENLITGAGLDTWPNYSEKTSDSVCTQYSSANCEKY